MFTTGSWSLVFAHNAKTGELLWQYDPEVPKALGGQRLLRCGESGSRRVEGRVYVGTLDGRLIALDAATGALVWSVNTIDKTKPTRLPGHPGL